MTIRIETNDGLPQHTKVTNAETGEEIKGVCKVIIEGEVKGIWTAVLWLNQFVVDVMAPVDKVWIDEVNERPVVDG